MNIFYLHSSPAQAAQWFVNKHKVKMIVETAQMLSTAHRVHDGVVKGKERVLPGEESGQQHCYRVAHLHHPSTAWTVLNRSNYEWHFQLFSEMLAEYTRHYKRKHSSENLFSFLSKAPANMPSGEFSPPPLAMPVHYKVSTDPVDCYRRFYAGDKWRFAKWKNDNMPPWFLDKMTEVWYDEGLQGRLEALRQALTKKTPPMDERVLAHARELSQAL